MTINKGTVPKSMTVFYNSVQFLACFYKIVTYYYLNIIICLFFQKIEISDSRYFACSRNGYNFSKIKYCYKMSNFYPSSISYLTYCVTTNNY